jgi:general secretion pathway protein A
VLVGQPELETKLKMPQLRQLRQRLTLRAKTHPLTLEETKAYVQQRLRIAGSDGRQIFDGDSLNSIHKYSNGIPRVVNLLCEHCLVSAFVDQKPTINESIVDAVARDFDLSDNVASGAMTVPAPPTPSNGEKFDLVEALRTLATLADRLRQSEQDLPKERKS